MIVLAVIASFPNICCDGGMRKETAIAIGWLTLPEAAERLRKSASTVERLVGAGHLRTKLEPVAGRKPMRLYSAEDVDKIAGAPRLNSRPNTPTSLAKSAPLSMPLAIPAEAISSLREVMTEWRNTQPAVSITQKIWLNIEEAQTYSGRTRNWLLRQCKAGKLEAEKDAGWRIRRTSLEA